MNEACPLILIEFVGMRWVVYVEGDEVADFGEEWQARAYARSLKGGC